MQKETSWCLKKNNRRSKMTNISMYFWFTRRFDSFLKISLRFLTIFVNHG
jgi:hypothetical protein